MDLLRKAWRSYYKRVMSPYALPIQVLETRRGFYGGAWEVICLLNAIDEPRTRDELLKKLAQEADAFKKSVGTPLEGRT